MKLLEELCAIHAPSGNEERLTKFLLTYIKEQAEHWAVKPEILAGNDFQNCIILKFGDPRTAIFAHIDSIGYTATYDNQLVKIGGPQADNGVSLVGYDLDDKLHEANLQIKNKNLSLKTDFQIPRATNFTYKPNFRLSKEFVQSPYLDNRLGVYNALKVCEKLTDGIIVFSCWEEHKGGSVPFLARFIFEKFNVKQALISDITWVTSGIRHGKGAAISMRDSLIPRRIYLKRILDVINQTKIPYQLEVEGAGGSDGGDLQKSPYPFDWCFIGAPEDNVHTPDEKVHLKDIDSMTKIYELLMKKL